jgi:hypothetical protein
MSNIKSLNKEKLEQFAKDSESWKEILEKCGYKTFKNNNIVKQKLIKYNIDFTHLPTRNLSEKKVSKDQLEEFVKESKCWKDLLKLCGYKNFSNNIYVQKKVNKFNFDVSHFEDYTPTPKKYTLDEIFCKNSTYNRGSSLKNHLIKHFNWDLKCQNSNCAIKNITDFKDPDNIENTVPLLIELDHIDGDNKNNEISNLRFLCILCHSLTNTYRTKNKNYDEKVIVETKCIDCNKFIVKDASRCAECSSISQRKVPNRPSLEQLNHDLGELKTFIAVGKKYDVSDNTIRKWIRTYKQKEDSDVSN